MKHLRFLPLLLLLALLPLLAFTGCGEETAPHEHRYGDWYTVTPPTHTETGVEARNCTSCEAKETRSVAATGHTFSEEWDYDADVHFHSCSCGATDREAPHDPDENGVCRGDCMAGKLAYLTVSGGEEQAENLGTEYWRRLCQRFGIPEFYHVEAYGLDTRPQEGGAIMAAACEKARALVETF